VHTDGDDGDDPFDWDEANSSHVARHGVEPWEVQDVFEDPDRRALSQGMYFGEQRFSIVGRTSAGRTLVVVFTMRSGRVRVVTSRRPAPRELRIYEGHRR
jgi:uncharacterized DUF497 family protein